MLEQAEAQTVVAAITVSGASMMGRWVVVAMKVAKGMAMSVLTVMVAVGRGEGA